MRVFLVAACVLIAFMIAAAARADQTVWSVYWGVWLGAALGAFFLDLLTGWTLGPWSTRRAEPPQ